MPSKCGIYCEKCDPGKGCTIHKDRPKECREYQCMWSQMAKVGIKLRPDRCHTIFDRISETTICGMQDPDHKWHPYMTRQIKEFNKQGFSVILRDKDINYMYMAPGHSRAQVKRDFNDRSKLYGRSN